MSAVDDMALELLARGESITFTARGASMRPFVRDGDLLTVSAGPARLGDVVLLSRDGRLGPVHRVVAAVGSWRLVKGDALPLTDGWVDAREIAGVVREIRRGSRRVRAWRYMAVAVSLTSGVLRRIRRIA